jgi:hypothetical protein
VFELVLGGLFLLIGLRSAVQSIRDASTEEPGRVRALIALHEAAKAGFWLALGAFFLGYATVREPQEFRWFVMVPIAMAGLRLVAATLLARL